VIDIDDGADLIDNERGINILSTTGSVTLFGNTNNDVLMYGVRDTGLPYFFAPPGAVAGGIIINGFVNP